jgi:hypothetical protein
MPVAEQMPAPAVTEPNTFGGEHHALMLIAQHSAR